MFETPRTNPSRLPLFNPTRRQAILLNSYDRQRPEVIEIVRHMNPEKMPRDEELKKDFEYNVLFSSITRGSRRVYDLEGILRGSIDLSGRVNQIPGVDQHQARLEKSLLEESYGELAIKDRKAKGLLYDQVLTYQALETELGEKFSNGLRDLSKDADRNTLTFCFITAHGDPSGFYVEDSKLIRYSDFLDACSAIPGKKCIVLFACHSGAILDHLTEREDKNDFTIITSCGKNQLAENWAEDRLFQPLVSGICDQKLFSDIEFSAQKLAQPAPNPLSLDDFFLDVRI
jgi:hypothetical protein